MLEAFRKFIISTKKKLIVFGAGSSGVTFIELIGKNLVTYFVDNNYKKDTYVKDISIEHPSKLMRENKDDIYIIIASMYYTEIALQLQYMGFRKRKHFEYYENVTDIGYNFYCPFCEGYFDKFLPTGTSTEISNKIQIIGSGYRENAICPYCNSIDRERHVYLFLKTRTKIFTNKSRVLHIAPEHNLMKSLLKNDKLQYICGEIEPNTSMGMVKIDITSTQFEDDFFDIIICNHVLEHIPKDRKAMEEIYRILKPKGLAILQVPISKNLMKTYEDFNVITPEGKLHEFGQEDHVRIYGMDYINKLNLVGFSVKTYNASENIASNLLEKMQIITDENIFVCYKVSLDK